MGLEDIVDELKAYLDALPVGTETVTVNVDGLETELSLDEVRKAIDFWQSEAKKACCTCEGLPNIAGRFEGEDDCPIHGNPGFR